MNVIVDNVASKQQDVRAVLDFPDSTPQSIHAAVFALRQVLYKVEFDIIADLRRKDPKAHVWGTWWRDHRADYFATFEEGFQRLAPLAEEDPQLRIPHLAPLHLPLPPEPEVDRVTRRRGSHQRRPTVQQIQSERDETAEDRADQFVDAIDTSRLFQEADDDGGESAVSIADADNDSVRADNRRAHVDRASSGRSPTVGRTETASQHVPATPKAKGRYLVKFAKRVEARIDEADERPNIRSLGMVSRMSGVLSRILAMVRKSAEEDEMENQERDNLTLDISEAEECLQSASECLNRHGWEDPVANITPCVNVDDATAKWLQDQHEVNIDAGDRLAEDLPIQPETGDGGASSAVGQPPEEQPHQASFQRPEQEKHPDVVRASENLRAHDQHVNQNFSQGLNPPSYVRRAQFGVPPTRQTTAVATPVTATATTTAPSATARPRPQFVLPGRVPAPPLRPQVVSNQQPSSFCAPSGSAVLQETRLPRPSSPGGHYGGALLQDVLRPRVQPLHFTRPPPPCNYRPRYQPPPPAGPAGNFPRPMGQPPAPLNVGTQRLQQLPPVAATMRPDGRLQLDQGQQTIYIHFPPDVFNRQERRDDQQRREPRPNPMMEHLRAQDLLKALPKFHGALEDWPAWAASANAYINTEGEDATKLEELKKKLSPDVQKLVRHIRSTNPQALNEFVDFMTNEFGQPEVVIRAQRQKLHNLKIPALKYEELRDFTTIVADSTSCLAAYGIAIDTDRQILDIVISRLPDQLGVAYYGKIEAPAVPNITSLLDFLRRKTESVRQQENSKKAANLQPQEKRPTDKKPEKKSPTRAFATSSPAPTATKCEVCFKPHFISSCPKFLAMSPDDRLQAVYNNKLHFYCLKPHPIRQCAIAASDQKCTADSDCKLRHHKLLHGATKTRDQLRAAYAARSSTGVHVLPPVAEGETAAEVKEDPCMGESDLEEDYASAEEDLAEEVDNHSELCFGEDDDCFTGDHEYSAIPQSDDRYSLRLVKVFVKPTNVDCKPKQIVALLDNGCSRTMIDEHFIRSFGVELKLKDETVATAHGSKIVPCADISLSISRDKDEWFQVPHARTHRKLRLKGPELRWKKFVEDHPDFKDVITDDVSFSQVRMFIGAELENEMLPVEEPNNRIFKDDILAVRSKFGWTLGGKIKSIFAGSMDNATVTYCNFTSCFVEGDFAPRILSELRRLNDQDALGIEPRKTKLSRGEMKDLLRLNQTTHWNNGRIRTKMLWKGDLSRDRLPETRGMAKQRLDYLEKRLAKLPGLRDKYKGTIDADLTKGYVRKLTPEQADELMKGPHWILPHFVVLHPDKPDRPRRVLDCAAKIQEIALNSLLRAGPNNLADLWGILIRFRSGLIVIGADITEMFSQIEVDPEDEAMIAFLWSNQPGDEPETYVNTRHVFGAKCSPSIAINAVHFAIARLFPTMLQAAMKEFYMDDLLHPCDDQEIALKNAQAYAQALAESGFHLRKWVSNCAWVLKQLPQEDLAPNFKEFVDKEEGIAPTMKALGMRWNTADDTLGFSTRLKFEEPKNVAECLSQLASVFDLLKITGPYIMKGKLLFRDILAEKSWKDPLTPDELANWMTWLRGLEEVAKLSIKRWFGFQKAEPVTLHVFSDASTDGYGASAILAGSGERRSFVASKCHIISKKKPLTVPKNELQALVVGVRMAESAVENLDGYTNITRLVFWVDSSCVWNWSRNEFTRYKEFVANRLHEISETFDRLKQLNPEVRWLPTGDNPADMASRGCDADEFTSRFGFWTDGPAWLTNEEQWPKPPEGPIKEEELKLREVFPTKAYATSLDSDNLKGFNSLRDYAVDGLEVQDPSPSDIKEIEVTLVKEMQQEAFGKVIKTCKEARSKGQQSIIAQEGPLRRKAVFVDRQGILRIVARYANARFLSWSERHPIPLAGDHPVARLLVREYHQRVHHQGSRTTHAALSKVYDVPFYCVKRVVFLCSLCRAANPLGVKVPQASLPQARLESHSYVFKQTGMDFFGPFDIKGRKSKVWAILFTCMTTRAVHLEPCPGIDIPTWLNALERFVSRRGKPERIWCDLASTFVGGSQEVHRLEVEQLTPEFLAQVSKEVKDRLCIAFDFIPPRSPHVGGAWERLIREAKQSLVKSTSTVAGLTYDAFTTFLARAECVINKRPLAIAEGLEIVSPASILAPASEMGAGFSSRLSVTRVLGQVRQAIDHFWSFWTEHYLKRLSACRFPPGHARFIQLQPGNKVMFKRREGFHSLDTRANLEAGTVTEVIPSADGVVRRVIITTKEGKQVDMPVRRVYLPEAQVVDFQVPLVGMGPPKEDGNLAEVN